MNSVGRTRPLDRLYSLKLRLGVIIVAGVGSAVATVTVGRSLGVSWAPSALLGIVVALILVQLLAHGTTSPLRSMAAAANGFREGDYSHRVQTNARDEVGQLARSFNSMADELAEVDRFRRELVANASHELRTPIAVARAVLENMVDGVQPANSETLRPVLLQMERLSRLVDQLLDLSRLESGAIPFATERVSLHALVEDVVHAVRLRSSSCKIRNDVPETLWALGDGDRLRQVLTNLVDNALRHSPKDQAVVVAGMVPAGEERLVEISVSDSGAGIPTEEAARVFERFTRLDSARSSGDGGAGLGLSIVKWIVDLHHGTIKVEQISTAPPFGCRLVVRLPRASP
jgi:signal transduction histidine kinase